MIVSCLHDFPIYMTSTTPRTLHPNVSKNQSLAVPSTRPRSMSAAVIVINPLLDSIIFETSSDIQFKFHSELIPFINDVLVSCQYQKIPDLFLKQHYSIVYGKTEPTWWNLFWFFRRPIGLIMLIDRTYQSTTIFFITN